ncbi:acylphosphatase-2 isoform X1 [Pituophis catenifer annectens]|uniref:acylphosphatase-2 isoform X1 n=2 Tax=Pituophis catenifer annectens TaxID=94852 RepID=UPI003994B5E9
MSRILKSVDYEVFGRVQGVCFRMYTEEKARKVGIVGWIKNTRQGTVKGQVQGPEEKVNEMLSHESGKMKQFEVNSMTFDGIKTKQNEFVLNGVGVALKPPIAKAWLTSVGSPSSRIDRTNFSNEKEISKLEFSGFITRY